MKKMNSIIQFMSYFGLVLVFFFISNISLNAQNNHSGLPKLTDSDLVFKDRNEAIKALDIKISEYQADMRLVQGENKQMVLNVANMYDAIKSEILLGNKVQVATIQIWEKYKAIFNGKYPDDCEAKLIDTITIQ